MPVFTDTFFGEHVGGDTYKKSGYIDPSYNTTSGFLSIYISENYSVDGWFRTVSRFKGNCTVEFSFYIQSTTGASGDIQVGVNRYDDNEGPYWNDWIGIDINHVDTSTVQLLGLGLNIQVATQTTHWLKFVEQPDGTIRMSYKPDGGSYTEYNSSDPILSKGWPADYTKNGWTLWISYESRSPYGDTFLRVTDMIITADTADIFDNWPTDMTAAMLEPTFFGASGFAPMADDPDEQWAEHFNPGYDSTPWVDNYPVVYNDKDQTVDYYWDSEYGDSGADEFLRWNDVTRTGFDGNVTYRVRIRWLSNRVVGAMTVGLFDMSEQYGLQIYWYRNTSDDAWNYSVHFDNEQGGSYLFQQNDGTWEIPFGVWLEYKLEEQPDKTVKVWWRYEGLEWMYIGQSTVTVPESWGQNGGCTPYFLADTWNDQWKGRSIWLQVDWIQATSIHNTLLGNMRGAMVADFVEPRSLWGSGWEFVLQHDVAYDDLFGTDSNAWAFLFPIPGMNNNGTYAYFHNASDDPLMIALKNRGDFSVYFMADDTNNPGVPSTDFVGLYFEVNGIECRFGLYYDSVDGNRRFGAIIDGTFHSVFSIVGSSSYLHEMWISLTDGRLVGRFKYSSYDETFVDITDWLGSPAEYIMENMEWRRTEIGIPYTELYKLEVFGQEKLALDLNGDIDASFELDNYMWAFLTAPVPANPGFFFHRTEVSGGGPGAVDSLNPLDLDGTGQPLTEYSTCLVITASNDIYVYRAFQQAGMTESLPDIVIPDNNPGDWYWQRVPARQFTPAKVQQFTELKVATPDPTFDNNYTTARQLTFTRVGTGILQEGHIIVKGNGSGITAWAADHAAGSQCTVWSIPFLPLISSSV